jgi:hypothetical protein
MLREFLSLWNSFLLSLKMLSTSEKMLYGSLLNTNETLIKSPTKNDLIRSIYWKACNLRWNLTTSRYKLKLSCCNFSLPFEHDWSTIISIIYIYLDVPVKPTELKYQGYAYLICMSICFSLTKLDLTHHAIIVIKSRYRHHLKPSSILLNFPCIRSKTWTQQA